MYSKNYKVLLSVGDVFIDSQYKSYKKITRISLQQSKRDKTLSHPIYHYVKCNEYGLERSFDTGSCYAEAIDNQIINQCLLAKRA